MAHSWGGFCATAVLGQLSLKLQSLVLLAPLTFAPQIGAMRGDLEAFVTGQKALDYPSDLTALLANFKAIELNFGPKVAKPDFSAWPKTLVVLGLEDQVTPSAVVREYFANSNSKVTYVEYPDNHWLTDRKQLQSAVLEYYWENL